MFHLLLGVVLAQAAQSAAFQVSPKDAADFASQMSWLRNATAEILVGCQIPNFNNTMLFTPDASESYGAQWTRDFAYMLMEANDLIDMALVKLAIPITIGGVREDGAFPDRVQTNGLAVYSPGDNWVDHADDNGPFGALLVGTYTELTNDTAYFCSVEPTLHLGLEFVNRSCWGLVYNTPISPNCTYGFTDTIAKTGEVLFTSLLYYQASRLLQSLSASTGCGNTSDYQHKADLIATNIARLWDPVGGLFFAGEIDCRQHDVWGSLFAVWLGLVPSANASLIVNTIVANYSGIFQSGQVRQLIFPQLWERCIESCPAPGTYQNGGYWATPLAWIIPVLASHGFPALALSLFNNTVANFQNDGIMECVNIGYHGVVNYTDSATSVYYAGKQLAVLLDLAW